MREETPGRLLGKFAAEVPSKRLYFAPRDDLTPEEFMEATNEDLEKRARVQSILGMPPEPGA